MSRDIQACIEVLNRRAVEYGKKARKHEKTHGINTYRHSELNLYRKAYEDAALAISKLKPTPRLPMTPKQAVARCIEILNDAQHSFLETLVCDVCFNDSAVYLMSKLEQFAATLSDDGEITDNTLGETNMNFATCNFEVYGKHFLAQMYPNKTIDAAKIPKFIELLGQDVLRIQDPKYHSPCGIVTGKNYSEGKHGELVREAIEEFTTNLHNAPDDIPTPDDVTEGLPDDC